MTIAEKIIVFPHEVLTSCSPSITKNDLKGELKSILEEVKVYVKNDKGAAGLALPQIGISKKAFVAKLMINDKEQTEVFINPRIIPFDREKRKGIEGCLSIPGEEFIVERFYGVEVIYQDLNFKTKKIKLKGWNARIAQHENDHLKGVLISQIGETVPSEITQ